MNIEFLKNCNDLSELKNNYRLFALKFHPDRVGGNENLFKQLNNEYEFLSKRINLYSDTEKNNINETANNLSEFKDIINELLFLDGIDIEIISKFIWVSGNTKQHKEKLKSLNFRFASKKCMWYYHNIENYKSFGSNNNIEDIRNKYGTQKINKSNIKKY